VRKSYGAAMNRKIILLVMFVLFLIADQVSKIAVQANMVLFESKTVIPGFFNITYVLNPGAAFGIFRNMPESFRLIFFVGVTTFACVFLLVLLYKEFSYKLRSFAYVAVVAGAVGNLIDRIRIGKVVDFLDFYVKDYHWYTFNFADCYITVGMAVLVLDVFINKNKVA
jgi:signal peptidase II